MKVCMFEFFFIYLSGDGGGKFGAGGNIFFSSSFCFVLLCFVTGNTFCTYYIYFSM